MISKNHTSSTTSDGASRVLVEVRIMLPVRPPTSIPRPPPRRPHWPLLVAVAAAGVW